MGAGTAALPAEGGMVPCLSLCVGEMEKCVGLMCLREPRIMFARSLGHLGASVGKGHLRSSEA